MPSAEKRTSSPGGVRTAILAAVALAGLGAGALVFAQDPTPTGSPSPSPSGSPTGQPGGATQDTAVIGAIAQLTGKLQAHVFLVGAATDAILSGDSAAVAATSAPLQENQQAIAGMLQAAGADPSAFDTLWSEHIGYHTQAAQEAAGGAGGATPTTTATATAPGGARGDMATWPQRMAEYFAGLNPQLDEAILEIAFTSHLESLAAYVDAKAQDSPDALQGLADEGDHMTALGVYLATGDDTLLQEHASGGGGRGGQETPTASPTGSGGSGPQTPSPSPTQE
jgi:hypothetical protein